MTDKIAHETSEDLISAVIRKFVPRYIPNAKEFKKHVADVAWETEVWLADTPDHMTHFNGDRFIGPR